MVETIAVTSEDDLAAWNVYFARGPEFADVPILPPRPGDAFDQKILEGLRRVLEQDRERVRSMTGQ